MNVLFVNHRTQNCGVQQFGKRLFSPALKSEKFNCYYIDVDNEAECQHWINALTPSIIVYNYYTGATMPWLHDGFLRAQSAKQLCVFHEVPIGLPFDGIVHQDPIDQTPGWFHISRPIPEYTNTQAHPEMPTFGSFGFGLGGKGFNTLVERVQEEYDTALIRINIPYAAFGDSDGRGAHSWANDCRARIRKPGILLEIGHEFFDESRLLDFLGSNSCNCFFYDANYGRGISGTLDYALAVDRPIAITRSYQFQHFWTYSDCCLIEQHSLHEILDVGTGPLNLYHEMWSNDQVLRDWEHIFQCQ